MTERLFLVILLLGIPTFIPNDLIDTDMADTEVERPVSPPQSVRLPDKGVLTNQAFASDIASDRSSQSLFFTKLPRELRAEIYRHAFGDRTFHMDFRFVGPTCKSTERPYHAGINGNAKGCRRPSVAQPQKWRWWGSICHRDMSKPFWIDTCQDGVGTCSWSPGLPAVPGICHVGVMGWIRSCRQA